MATLIAGGTRGRAGQTGSATFTLAKQQDYFQGQNPARDTAINPGATEPQETYAYSFEEIMSILAVLPPTASTAFAVAAFMGLRHGEIQGLLWENYHDGEMCVSRSIWNGRVTDPKTRKGRAPGSVVNRAILPTLRRCAVRRKAESDHRKADHVYRRDDSLPE